MATRKRKRRRIKNLEQSLIVSARQTGRVLTRLDTCPEQRFLFFSGSKTCVAFFCGA
jgi:hypothetical protein